MKKTNYYVSLVLLSLAACSTEQLSSETMDPNASDPLATISQSGKETYCKENAVQPVLTSISPEQAPLCSNCLSTTKYTWTYTGDPYAQYVIEQLSQGEGSNWLVDASKHEPITTPIDIFYLPYKEQNASLFKYEIKARVGVSKETYTNQYFPTKVSFSCFKHKVNFGVDAFIVGFAQPNTPILKLTWKDRHRFKNYFVVEYYPSSNPGNVNTIHVPGDATATYAAPKSMEKVFLAYAYMGQTLNFRVAAKYDYGYLSPWSEWKSITVPQ